MNSRADIFIKKLIQFIPKAALVKITFLTIAAEIILLKLNKLNIIYINLTYA